ncbi:hypothetical protein A3A40_00600 [Candidatus Kaiserbacteria bacterium RIFCSPLOWO2_01_FULL_54_20]|uniref:Uncharacterized protein n=1 Tax=Candidatus Kaiserbacteria bacterium RIFCSPLOWO2_01_FULL_54_20 TaxID=1798513 RepID=A0A1F6EJT9_9BACT|nr:MAG: hypothetical protein A3A40_00600 [Candidatus Kaiserbacteria bacterium RIFCSPLOWO2_01_FULL_54_20]
MFGFVELFKDTEGLVLLVFILASISSYSSGSAYGDSMLIQGLGAIKLIPLIILKSLSGISPLVAAICALAFLWYMGMLREIFGAPMMAVMTMALIILMVGG